MPRERTRRQPRARTRTDLLEAAGRVFARQGFTAASVEAVAADAGYSTGALYSNFKSKEELFLKLFEERMERRGEEIRRLLEAGERPDLQLTAITDEFMQVVEHDRDWYLLLFEFWTYAARNPAFAERFLDHHRAAQGRLAELIATGAAELGLELPVSADQLAMTMTALGYGFALERLLGEERVPRELLGHIVALLLRGLEADR